AGALLGVAVNKSDNGLAYLTLIPIVAFWLLDGYLLWAERCFRALFETVRASDKDVAPFKMAATGRAFQRSARAAGYDIRSWGGTMVRPVLLVFYLGMGVATVVIGILVA